MHGLADIARHASGAAEAAARASRVTVREVHDLGELRRVSALYDRIWQADPTDPPITTSLMRALTHAGNYLAAAFADEEMVGACVGFLAAPIGRALHSHMAGVAPHMRGRAIGFALKAHQRAWALARGLTRITWTFDPLVARNAHVNLVKLGAEPVEYLPDFYGSMEDRINAGDLTDRLLVAWRLDAPGVVRCCLGEHQEPDVDALRSAGAAIALGEGDGRPRIGTMDAPVVLLRVPADVERLRVEDPPLALEWRRAQREVLGGLVAGGARVSFARSGWYVAETERARRRSEAGGRPREGRP